MKDLTCISRNKIAVSDNLIKASYNLDWSEQCIIYCILARTNQSVPMEADKWYTVSVEDFSILQGKVGESADGFRVQENIIPRRKVDARNSLQKAILSLYDKSMTIKNPITCAVEHHRWVISIREMFDSNDEIALKWHPEIIEQLTKLKSYASFHGLAIIGIRGQYTHKLLEILSQERSRGRIEGQVEISIEDLTFSLGVEGSYKEYKYLKRLVLGNAIKELLDLRICSIIEYKEKKQGKRVVGLVFRVKFNEIVKEKYG